MSVRLFMCVYHLHTSNKRGTLMRTTISKYKN